MVCDQVSTHSDVNLVVVCFLWMIIDHNSWWLSLQVIRKPCFGSHHISFAWPSAKLLNSFQNALFQISFVADFFVKVWYLEFFSNVWVYNRVCKMFECCWYFVWGRFHLDMISYIIHGFLTYYILTVLGCLVCNEYIWVLVCFKVSWWSSCWLWRYIFVIISIDWIKYRWDGTWNVFSHVLRYAVICSLRAVRSWDVVVSCTIGTHH